MSFLHKVAGLSLRDRVRISDILRKGWGSVGGAALLSGASKGGSDIWCGNLLGTTEQLTEKVSSLTF